MSTLPVDSAEFMSLFIALKASVLLAIAALGHCMLRRRGSAATQHLVLTLAVTAVLVLPLAWWVTPEWRAGSLAWATSSVTSTPPAPSVAGPSVTLAEASSAAPSDTPRNNTPTRAAPIRALSLQEALILVYGSGVGLMLAHLIIQHLRLRRFVMRAALVQNPYWTRLLEDCARQIGVHGHVQLLRSESDVVPLTFGVRGSRIILPASADEWAEDRRRAVILHELAHVARRDCLTQTLACLARAVYWFNPVAWWVARQLRIERELACDDRVIAAGTEPRDYAGHLLEIAYSLGRTNVAAYAVGMARPGQLEGRMVAALDGCRNRRMPTLRTRIGAIVATLTLVSALAGATPALTPENIETSCEHESDGNHASLLPPTLHELRLPLIDDARRFVRDASAALARESSPGTWELRPTSAAGMVHLRITEERSSHGSDIRIDRLEGLSAEQLTSGGPVRFRLRRDAGTFEFDGVARNGVAAGTFSFTPDARFADELTKRGFARPTEREQYQLAQSDTGYAFLDELKKQGYATPALADIVRAGQHGVGEGYLREMGELGYRLGALDPLIALRDHGVTPEYVRGLASLGYKGLSADDLRRARDHGVTPEYVQGMREAGYGAVSIGALVEARDHGVTAEYVRALQDAGYRSVPLDGLIRVRDHGVTPEYVRDLRQLGYAPSLDDLVRARDHGVTAEYVRAFRELGHAGIPLDSLIRLRDHGVTPEYARDVKALGYERLGPEDLVTLRDHGLTPDRIRAANTRAGAQLSVDQLKSFASGGSR
jgi:beta-lactamase regulating signal transducer with metallopeptidase domain